MSRLLIIGASSGIGLETVSQALEAGHEVVAFSRSAEDIELTHRNLTKMNGDATDPTDIDRGISDCDIVYTVIGIAPTFKSVDTFSKAASNTIAAMQKNGTKRLVAVTGLGAGNSKGVGGFLYSSILQPCLLGPIYADKDREEELIRSSDLDWTIVRPGVLTRLPKTGNYNVLKEPREWKFGFITRADVADFLVNHAQQKEYIHETPVVVGK